RGTAARVADRRRGAESVRLAPGFRQTTFAPAAKRFAVDPFEHEEGGVAVALEAERPNDIRMRQQADVLELALESAELLRAARNVRRQDQGGDMRAAVLPAQPVTRPVDRPEAPLLELLLEHEPIAQHGRDTARPGLRL